MNTIKIKRIYEPSSENDGYRILVDRLWPRGISKEKAGIDMWAKCISPSTELRKEFNHELNKMSEFRNKYTYELETNNEALEFIEHLKEIVQEENVTLLFAAKNETVNHAVILKEWIEEKIIS